MQSLRRRSILPAAGILQRVGDFLGHIGFIVLGEDLRGHEGAIGCETAFGDHPLTFAEQVGQNAVKADRYRAGEIGHAEQCRRAGLTDAALLDQSAEPESLTR